MSNLIIYPHGLGDCLMLTPAIREYYLTHRVKPSVAILKRFKNTEIFKNNPFIDKIFYLNDPWHDYQNHMIGFQEVEKDGIKLAQQHGISKAIMLMQPPPRHKITINAEFMSVNLSSNKIDIFTNNNDKKIANDIIKSNVGNNKFGFIQTYTGAGKSKDLPDGFGEKWLKQNRNLNHFIEIGKTFKYDEYNINVQFEILRKANAVCIPDSVFYHACSGLDKNIDFVYFGRGNDVYVRVGNLNKNINENVNFKLI